MREQQEHENDKNLMEKEFLDIAKLSVDWETVPVNYTCVCTPASSAFTEVCTALRALKQLSLAEPQLLSIQLELFIYKLMSDKMNEPLI